MRLNVFQKNKEKLKGDIVGINVNLSKREPKKVGDLEISGIRVKGITRDKDLIYQVFGRCKNICYSINITRLWSNLMDEDIRAIEGCCTLKQFFALNQKV
ncbi:MAG: hypothetical protein Q4D02_04575 [Clostridia bacterium]|nr:hypothetical protein [Clostridia bacterium]